MHWFDRFAAQAAARSHAPPVGASDPTRASRRGFLTKVAAFGGGAAATAAVLPLDSAGAAVSCAPNVLCGSICVNTSKDQDNCGACGNVCPPGDLCSLGKCCPCGSVNCGGVCTDVWHDPSNCGKCGKHCRHGQTCISGKCVTQYTSGCSTASDCGVSTGCKTFTCTAGVCGSTFTAAGVVVAGQTAGDCKVNVCDGSGNIVVQVDNNDKPANTACATGTCTGGSPGFTYAAAGSACAGGACDGQGVCVGSVQCTVPADCGSPPNQCTVNTCIQGVCGTAPAAAGSVCTGGACDGQGVCVGTNQCSVVGDCGTSTECVTFTCTQGVCGSSFTASGVPVGSQTAGDCHVNVCDGGGSIVSQIDDTDTPSTGGNICVIGLCIAGAPSLVPASSGTVCQGGSCDGTGVCVQSP